MTHASKHSDTHKAAAGGEAPGDPVAPPESPEQAAPAADPSAEVEKFRDLALRARAELDNYRKRMAREKEEAIRHANLSFLDRLLPILDSFDLGLQAAQSAADAAAVVSGFEMVKKQLDEFLQESGVETIEAEGAAFDHHLHDAVGHEPSKEVPEGSVIRQLRKGYKHKGRLLRAASVFVSSGPPGS